MSYHMSCILPVAIAFFIGGAIYGIGALKGWW